MKGRIQQDISHLSVCVEDIRGDERCTGWVTRHMRDCPHMLAMLPISDGVDDQTHRVICVLALPEDKKWWAEMLQESPSLIGARSVEVTWSPEAWPKTALLPETVRAGRPPCEADCPKCPQYRTRCKGCPSSEHYLTTVIAAAPPPNHASP
jgi:hypothetical protein